jgi:hypothetical protein
MGVSPRNRYEGISFMKKKIGLVLIACLALAAFSASASQAAWKIGSTELTNGQSETVSVSGGEFTLSSKVLGAEFVLKATGLTCSGTCAIDQAGTVDHSSGKLAFTGVTVSKPTGCTVASTLTTNSLVDELIMDGSTVTFDKFKPASGEVFIEIGVTGCAAEGTYPVKGTVTGRTSNTGVAAVSQALTFNAAEQTTGGGSLKLGKETATLVGSATNALSGPNFGASWSGS